MSKSKVIKRTTFNVTQFQSTVKELAEEYERLVRNKEARSQYQQQSDPNGTTLRDKSVGSLTEAQWRLWEGYD